MMEPDIEISAVVPTRDRPELLRRALHSIASQTTGSVLEIVVVYFARWRCSCRSGR